MYTDHDALEQLYPAWDRLQHMIKAWSDLPTLTILPQVFRFFNFSHDLTGLPITWLWECETYLLTEMSPC